MLYASMHGYATSSLCPSSPGVRRACGEGGAWWEGVRAAARPFIPRARAEGGAPVGRWLSEWTRARRRPPSRTEPGPCAGVGRRGWGVSAAQRRVWVSEGVCCPARAAVRTCSAPPPPPRRGRWGASSSPGGSRPGRTQCPAPAVRLCHPDGRDARREDASRRGHGARLRRRGDEADYSVDHHHEHDRPPQDVPEIHLPHLGAPAGRGGR